MPALSPTTALWILTGLWVASLAVVVLEYRRGAQRERLLWDFVEWANAADEILRRVEDGGPDEPATAPIAEVVSADLRRVLDEQPTTVREMGGRSFTFRANVTDR